jgi:23S rRNA pseudouridine1911/1915/1917 synthase
MAVNFPPKADRVERHGNSIWAHCTMNATPTQITATEKDAGKRLDIFIAEARNMPRSQAQRMIRSGCVLVDGAVETKPGLRMHADRSIKIVEKPKEEKEKTPDKKITLPSIEIVQETNDYLVLVKPAGVLTHPTQAHEPDTLAAWINNRFPETHQVGDKPDVRPGIVHRLDKDTSGLMVVAKTQAMFDHLKKQFKQRRVTKEYIVLVYGAFESDHGIIDFDIDRGKDGRMVSRPKTNPYSLKTVDKIQPGKKAVTEFWVEKRFVRFSLLRVKLHTGRTHQIRVHMFASNHPVVGDLLYVNKKYIKKGDPALGRLFLHAGKLCFYDLKETQVCFEKQIPDTLQICLDQLT